MPYFVEDQGKTVKCDTLREYNALVKEIERRGKGRSQKPKLHGDESRKNIGAGQARVWGMSACQVAMEGDGKTVSEGLQAMRSNLAALKRDDPTQYVRIRNRYQEFLQAYAAKNKIKNSVDAQAQLKLFWESEPENFIKMVRAFYAKLKD